ncbi:nck-associated protein 1-like isoform X4 [Lineus longissimus]|uniref:nck-associated protein 1-like isoform X4 n=1 Tax=Lineus longissimus TaxID=88925 RepID=UPI00315D45B2
MSRGMIPSQQKLAERLTILNDRGTGILTRTYNIKRMLGNPELKPSFLTDKSLENCIRPIVKKFPNLDSKAKELQSVNVMKSEICKSLALYYDTFVDILIFKDHVTNLLTTFDACQVYLDITLCYDLTKGYLDLMVTYFSIMLLIFRIDDRKAVLGLYNHAHELQFSKGAENYPRLGQMVLDYDPPWKKMCEEFVPHSKLVNQALLSLAPVYQRRNQPAVDMRGTQVLSLIAEPNKIMSYVPYDAMPCEYISVEVLERWIIMGYVLCHQQLMPLPAAQELWKAALTSCYVIDLCRDEVLAIHPFISQVFEGIKGYTKKTNEVKELHQTAIQTAPTMHKDRRKFLRTALKELALLFTDQPGLLGPKARYIFVALTMARDEIKWLLRHAANPPVRKGMRVPVEEFVDRQLPELLFHVEELRALVKKYNQVLQRYYIQMMSGYDAPLLNELMQTMTALPEDESVIMSSFCSTMQALSVKQVEENELFDFRGIRLDWFRLQAYTSISKAAFNLHNHHKIAHHLNSVTFHTKMVDSLDEMLLETSDLSLYCFYTTLFEQQFKHCMEFPAQHRYSIAFPMICAHFMNATHELCPEERNSIGTTSVQYAHWFIKEMSEEVNQVIVAVCDEQRIMTDKLLPKNCAAQTAQAMSQKKAKSQGKKTQEPDKPGQESYRKHREDFKRIDKLHMALTELCYALNYCSVITVWEHGFVPREFFTQQLEVRFNKTLVGIMMYNPETCEIAKPSELLSNVQAMMSVLQSLENYIHIDVTRVFNNVLLQQTQPTDSFAGDRTITSNYTDWYLEVLLRRVSSGHIVYSPSQKAFVNLGGEGALPFTAEEYADIMELRALAELIGPYGMRYLSQRLMWHISSQVDELKKMVVANKDILSSLRSSYDKPEQMKDLFRRLGNRNNKKPDVDSVLQRMTIVGVLLCFRALAQEALNDVLENRIPFLLSSIRDFQQHVPAGQDSMIVNEMASAAGMPCNIDPQLCAALRSQKTATNPPPQASGDKRTSKTPQLDHSGRRRSSIIGWPVAELGEDEYNVACLMMVFVAVALPKLAMSPESVYKAALEGHANNIHCLAKAINSLAAALFTIHQGDVEERLKEFLALASSSLLRLGQETDKELIKNRESVYLLLDQLVQESPWLTMDLLESCFPYCLLRNSYHAVYRQAEGAY